MATAAARLRREGWIEGERLGKRGPLLLQLRQRFGPLPAAVTARIARAGVAELDAWLGRVLTASTLDEVLAVEGRR